VAQGVRPDRLCDPGPPGDAPDDASGAVAVEAAAVGSSEDRSLVALADGQVDRSCGAGCQRDGDDLAALAQNGQSAVSTLEAKGFDVCAGRF
jgi:hypothetical protein